LKFMVNSSEVEKGDNPVKHDACHPIFFGMFSTSVHQPRRVYVMMTV
jgi:hypothetical protein